MWLDILILGHLRHRPAHGYEIKQRVGHSIGHTVPLNNNVLYPALRRLDEMGALDSELVPQDASPPRRVYRLTERGAEALRSLVEDFPEEVALNDAEFNVRLGYFELIGPPVRLEIVRKRAAAVEGLLRHLRGALEETVRDPEHLYSAALLEFLIKQREAELDFLATLSSTTAVPPARASTSRSGKP